MDDELNRFFHLSDISLRIGGKLELDSRRQICYGGECEGDCDDLCRAFRANIAHAMAEGKNESGPVSFAAYWYAARVQYISDSNLARHDSLMEDKMTSEQSEFLKFIDRQIKFAPGPSVPPVHFPVAVAPSAPKCKVCEDIAAEHFTQ